MKYLRRVLLAVLIAVLIIALASLMARRKSLGGKVDASTPLAQNGFVLVDVQQIDKDGRCPYGGPGSNPRYNAFYVGGGDAVNDDPGGVGLWIRQPPGAPNRFWNPPALDTTARSSTGDVFHLSATTYTPGVSAGNWFTRVLSLLRPSRTPEPLLVAHFPGGYPDNYKYMDVSVRDKQGHQARWRVNWLPRSQHRVPAPPVIQDTTRVGNVTIKARAWRASGTGDGMRGGIGYDLSIKMPDDPTYVWNLPDPRGECEWEPSLYAPAKPNVGTGGWFSGTIGMGGMPFPAYYLHYQRFASLRTVLQQFAKDEEKVTFHELMIKTVGGKNPMNYLVLSRPQTQTTPSGIAITLRAQGVWPPATSSQYFHDGPQFRLTPAAPPKQPASFPASPLSRRYHRPILLDVSPDDLVGDDGKVIPRSGSSGGNDQRYGVSLRTPQPHLKHLRSLTFRVTQRVLLHETPVQFTVPVGDTRPRDF